MHPGTRSALSAIQARQVPTDTRKNLGRELGRVVILEECGLGSEGLFQLATSGYTKEETHHRTLAQSPRLPFWI
jgi:hypothetical protein